MPRPTQQQYEQLIANAKAGGRLHHIKVHLTMDPPVNGLSGESLWALVDAGAFAAFGNDSCRGERFVATIDNDSVFFEELYAGLDVEIETRGESLPEILVPADWTVR